MAADEGLKKADFHPLDLPPLPQELRISQSTAWYADRLYIGLGRGPLSGPGSAGADPGVGARLIRLVPGQAPGEEIWRSPVIDGKARDRSIRAMTVFDGALICAVGSLEGQVVMLRSDDGINFAEWGQPGLGLSDADIASVRSLVQFQGRIHTSPTGKNRGRGFADDNMTDVPVVFAADQGGQWTAAGDPGFGDPGNLSINELAVFNGCLYAATLNPARGFQVWKTEGGEMPYRWHKVVDRGAWRHAANPVPAAMHVHGDALYIGTGVQRQGADGIDRFGPIAPELIRIDGDDRWEIVCGEPRATPDGLRLPSSGCGPGFDQPYTQTFWRFASHGQWLYLGTSDWRLFPSFLRGRADISSARLEVLQRDTASYAGQYCLWKSRDGQTWEAVTSDGLGGGPNHYGIRELLSTPAGLVVGAASRGQSEANDLAFWLGGRP